MSNHDLSIDPQSDIRLALLSAMDKFCDDGQQYTGIADLRLRNEAASTIDQMIDRIATGIKSQPNADFILSEFRAALLALDKLRVSDTEDREAACSYLELVMDAVGLESSDGLLNGWLYGFDPNEADEC